VRETPLGAKTPSERDFVGCFDDSHRTPGDEGEIAPICKRRSQRDHLFDGLGRALRKDLGQQPAPAVPDQANA
jgi:hypothetical protein